MTVIKSGFLEGIGQYLVGAAEAGAKGLEKAEVVKAESGLRRIINSKNLKRMSVPHVKLGKPAERGLEELGEDCFHRTIPTPAGKAEVTIYTDGYTGPKYKLKPTSYKKHLDEIRTVLNYYKSPAGGQLLDQEANILNKYNIELVASILKNKCTSGQLSDRDIPQVIELAKAINEGNTDVISRWHKSCSIEQLNNMTSWITTKNKGLFLKMAEMKNTSFLEMYNKVTPEIEEILLKMLQIYTPSCDAVYDSKKIYEIATKAIDFMERKTDKAKIIADIIESPRVDVLDKMTVLKNIRDNNFLSENLLSHFRKVMNGEPIVKEFAAGTPARAIICNISDGEVITIGKKLFVKDGESLERLRMTKEEFFELWPPIKTFMSEQGTLGDCWLITDDIFDNDVCRAKLYQLLAKIKNDIFIIFPDGKNIIKFTDGKIVASPTGKNVNGPLGLRMLERAFSIHRPKEYTNKLFEDIKAITDVDYQMMKLNGGLHKEALIGFFGKDAVKIVIDNTADKQLFPEIIKKYSPLKDHIISFATIKKGNEAKEIVLNSSYDLVSQHQYSIKGYNEVKGMVYITQPWHNGFVTEVPIEELLPYIDHILVARVIPSNKYSQAVDNFNISNFSDALKESKKIHTTNGGRTNNTYDLGLMEELHKKIHGEFVDKVRPDFDYVVDEYDVDFAGIACEEIKFYTKLKELAQKRGLPVDRYNEAIHKILVSALGKDKFELAGYEVTHPEEFTLSIGPVNPQKFVSSSLSSLTEGEPFRKYYEKVTPNRTIVRLFPESAEGPKVRHVELPDGTLYIEEGGKVIRMQTENIWSREYFELQRNPDGSFQWIPKQM